jgi:hypothetical protein
MDHPGHPSPFGICQGDVLHRKKKEAQIDQRFDPPREEATLKLPGTPHKNKGELGCNQKLENHIPVRTK